jgi:hypothetical protein
METKCHFPIALRHEGRLRFMKKGHVWSAIISGLWLAVIMAGWIALTRYAGTPGAQILSPSQWPAESKIPLDPASPTLVMFVHPQCPCSVASMGELEALLAHTPQKLSVHILFLDPAGSDKDWTHSDLWKLAEAIPGVTIWRDTKGTEAGLFHADTSGHSVLYSSAGCLMFQGGITVARGHLGDNAGLDAVLALAGGKTPAQTHTAVFGCPLFDSQK